MDNGFIVPYRPGSTGAMGGPGRASPARCWPYASKPVAWPPRQIRAAGPPPWRHGGWDQREGGWGGCSATSGQRGWEPLPARKASSQTLGRPYRKPTQVGWCQGTKADGGPSVKELGNLTPYLRKKGCPVRVRPLLPPREQRAQPEGVAAQRPRRLFTKNTGLREGASRRMGADACPVPAG